MVCAVAATGCAEKRAGSRGAISTDACAGYEVVEESDAPKTDDPADVEFYARRMATSFDAVDAKLPSAGLTVPDDVAVAIERLEAAYEDLDADVDPDTPVEQVRTVLAAFAADAEIAAADAAYERFYRVDCRRLRDAS